jgi:hypothetical protein
LIAAAMQYSSVTSVMMGSGQSLLGFLLGASLAFLNKGYNVDGVRTIIEMAVDSSM